MAGKKIVEVRNDPDGDVASVRFQWNQTWTPIPTAVRMAENGQIEGVHAVHPRDGDPFIRSNPDGKVGNNLDELAEK
jgi:hypothetical protein